MIIFFAHPCEAIEHSLVAFHASCCLFTCLRFMKCTRKKMSNVFEEATLQQLSDAAVAIDGGAVEVTEEVALLAWHFKRPQVPKVEGESRRRREEKTGMATEGVYNARKVKAHLKVSNKIYVFNMFSLCLF